MHFGTPYCIVINLTKSCQANEYMSSQVHQIKYGDLENLTRICKIYNLCNIYAFSNLTNVCCSMRTGSYWGRCQRMLTPKLLEISSRVWTRRRTSIQETTTTRKFYKSTENLKDGVGSEPPLLHSAQKGRVIIFNLLLLIIIHWNYSFSLVLVFVSNI